VTAIGTPAIEIVRRAGIAHRVHAYELADRHGRERDARPAYGVEAATALGVSPDRVYKTLVAAVDERILHADFPVASEIEHKRIADASGGSRAELADTSLAARATGYVIGGISPLGSRRAIPVVLDARSSDHPTIYVSAGRRGLQLELSPADLARLAGAITAHIGRDH
jgi:Cys-tRNA(Pro)/Cys-tRNA(Cys) deacylase